MFVGYVMCIRVYENSWMGASNPQPAAPHATKEASRSTPYLSLATHMPTQQPPPPKKNNPPQRYSPNPVAAITEREFSLAKRILGSFDLILITEHLAWQNQTDYARALLLGPGAAAEEKRQLEEEKEMKGRDQGLKPQHHNRLRGKGDESAIDAATLRDLWRANQWDILLYDYARNLVAERVAAFEKGEWPPKGDGRACRAPVNDPNFLRDPPPGQKPDKPFRDSYLFTAPLCVNNDYGVQELDERLDFAW
jgi:hypothetical protein